MKAKKINKIAPILSNISKENGFKIPENYFESVEDGVFAHISKNKLHNLNTTNFKTPANYFDSIEDKVITKLKSELLQNETTVLPDNYFDGIEDKVFAKLAKKQKVISFRKNTIKYVTGFAIAASLALIFILTPQKNNSEITFDAIETSEIEQLIQNGLIEVNAVTLTAAFPDIEVDASLNNINLSNEDLLNYLDSENIENMIYDN